MLSLEDILNSVEKLSVDDKEYLFNVLRQRLIEARKAEILANYEELKRDIQEGKAKMGTIDDLIADLLGEDDETCLE